GQRRLRLHSRHGRGLGTWALGQIHVAEIDIALGSLPDDGMYAGGREAVLGVVGRARVPEDVKVEVRRSASSALEESLLKALETSLRDLGGDAGVPPGARAGVFAPDAR